MVRTIALVFVVGCLAAPASAQTVTAGTFHNCPEGGRTKVATVKALNVLKNRATAPDTFDRRATLEALLAPGNDLDRWNTDDGAELEGYVVDVVPGGIESVNCGSKVIQYRDTHIFIGATPNAKKTACVVVEVTPRWRSAMAGTQDWATAALKKLKGQRVAFGGFLFRDDEHKQNAVNTNPHGKSDWRATIWEIHPVTSIKIIK